MEKNEILSERISEALVSLGKRCTYTEAFTEVYHKVICLSSTDAYLNGLCRCVCENHYVCPIAALISACDHSFYRFFSSFSS